MILGDFCGSLYLAVPGLLTAARGTSAAQAADQRNSNAALKRLLYPLPQYSPVMQAVAVLVPAIADVGSVIHVRNHHVLDP